MFDPSKALRPTTLATYFKKDYSLASNSYFTQGNQIQGEWHGELAKEIGLSGTVTEEHFKRLAAGQDPFSGEQLIEHRDTEKAKARAGWDLTVNAPKSVSLAALVGGDERVLAAHRAANRAALDTMQEYVQQRMGGNNLAIGTNKWIVASFEHNTSRPVDGYPAPHLHTHNVLFNMTAIDGNSQARAVQERAIFQAQKLGTAVYQAELGWRLQELGYGITRGTNNAPDIKGFTKEYMDAESLRTQHFNNRLEELGLQGRTALKILAHQDREAKLDLRPDELKAIHSAHAELHGNQPQRIAQEARSLGHKLQRSVYQIKQDAYRAVEYARTKCSERTAVFDEHETLRQALQVKVGNVRIGDVRAALNEHKEAGKLVEVAHVRPYAPGHRYTTPEMLDMERAVLEWARQGRGSVKAIAADETLERYDKLKSNEPRRQVIQGYLRTTDQLTLLRGGAGTGKTTTLRMITEVARENGYKVVGMAPVSKAVAAMKKEGIDAQTLQKFVKRDQPDDDRKRLFLLDEASLGPTKSVHAFMQRVRPQDHVIWIGDTRQHKPIQAGFLFEQLMEAGIKVGELNRNYRQQNEELKLAVNLMAANRIPDALKVLDKTNRIEEYGSLHDRYQAIAKTYCEEPVGTVVISPDNDSRRVLNSVIREEMRSQGFVEKDRYSATIYLSRDVHDEDRKLAETYRVGDHLRYHQAHKKLGIPAQSYAMVKAVDPAKNEITVTLKSGKDLTYNPARAYGVSLYDSRTLPLAIGDRVQLTSPFGRFSNRDMGSISELDRHGNIKLQLDDGRVSKFNLKDNPHVDHAYTMTSHSIQGETVNRALLNIEVTNSHVDALLDRTSTYVGSSRPRHELKMFVDSKAELEKKLDRVHEPFKALSIDQTREYRQERSFGVTL